jgi:uracil-DNA glycosylase
MNNLEKICEEIKGCNKCNLCSGRTNAVPGYGHEKARILFIGEGPGKDEDLQGKPFVGASGKFLTKLIESIGLSREDVFITNVVKCRPPENRDPLPDEINACWAYLVRQIKEIKPLVIATLGRHSMARFLPDVKISEAHGQPKIHKGIWCDEQVYVPLYHPAVALYDPRKRQVLLDDFQVIPKVIKKLTQSKKPNDS